MVLSRLPVFKSRWSSSLPAPKVFARDVSYFLFLFTAIGVPSIIFVNDNAFRIQTIKGASMYPYLNKDYNTTTRRDVAFIWKHKPTDGIERGMIVCLWSPYHPEVRSVKRVIALEGDKVFTKGPYPHPICEVPAGHVWVEGDGRHMGKESLDSNYYGPVSKNLILGKVTRLLWPWSDAGRVRWEEWRPKTVVLKRRDDTGSMWI